MDIVLRVRKLTPKIIYSLADEAQYILIYLELSLGFRSEFQNKIKRLY